MMENILLIVLIAITCLCAGFAIGCAFCIMIR